MKNLKTLAEHLNEGRIKKGQQFNADGITWKVIKVGSTQSEAEAITKSEKGRTEVYDNKTISKFVESVNEGVIKTSFGSFSDDSLAALYDTLQKKFQKNSHISKSFWKFLEKSVKERFGSLKNFMSDFEDNVADDTIGEGVNEGMSKSAIKKEIKTIDKMIDDETGGDGEPLTSETLQDLERERERLEKLLKESLNEGTDISSWNQGGTSGDKNVLITQFVGPKKVEDFGLGRKCLQINVGMNYVQLNPADIVELKDVLKNYRIK